MQISVVTRGLVMQWMGAVTEAVTGACGWWLSLVKLPNKSLKIRECMDYPVTLGHGRYFINLLFCVRI